MTELRVEAKNFPALGISPHSGTLPGSVLCHPRHLFGHTTKIIQRDALTHGVN